MDKGELSKVCYTTVNQGLRDSAESVDQVKRQQGEKVRGEWKIFISHLSTTLSELKGTTGTHYRGQSYIPPDTPSLKPGNAMVWPAFTSCSTKQSVGLHFSRSKLLYEIKILFEYGGSVREYSYYKSEDELVFPPFTSFRVDEVMKKSG